MTNAHSVHCPRPCEHAKRDWKTGIVTYPATVEYLAAAQRIKAVTVPLVEGTPCAHCDAPAITTTAVLTDGVETSRRSLCGPCIRAKYL